jgi:hypothetical protein
VAFSIGTVFIPFKDVNMLPSVNPSRGAGAASAARSVPALAAAPAPAKSEEYQTLIGHIDVALRNANTEKGKALGNRLRSQLPAVLAKKAAKAKEAEEAHLGLLRSRLTGLENLMRERQLALERSVDPQPGHATEVAIVKFNGYANRIRKELGLPEVKVDPLATREKAEQRLEMTVHGGLKELHLECIAAIVSRGNLDEMRGLRNTYVGIRTQLKAQSQAVGAHVEKRWTFRTGMQLAELRQAISELEKGIMYAEFSGPLDDGVKEREQRIRQAETRITDIETLLAFLSRGSSSELCAMGLDEQILRQEVHLLDREIALLHAERGLRMPSQQEFNLVHNRLWQATKQCWEAFRDTPENSPAEQRLGKEYHYLLTRKNTLRSFYGQKLDKNDPYKQKAAQKLKSHLERAFKSLGLDAAVPLPASPGRPLSATDLAEAHRSQAFLTDALKQKWHSGTPGPEVAEMYHLLEVVEARLTQHAHAVKFRDEILPNHISQLQTQLASQGLSEAEVAAAEVQVRDPFHVPDVLVDAGGFLHGPAERRSALPVVRASELPVVFPSEGLASRYAL